MMDAVPGWQEHANPLETCALWTSNLEWDERRVLFDTADARNYLIRAETSDRETLWRLLPLCNALFIRDLSGLVDDLEACIEFADRLRAAKVELIHVGARGADDTAYSRQHARILSLVRSLQRLGHRPEPGGPALIAYWRIM